MHPKSVPVTKQLTSSRREVEHLTDTEKTLSGSFHDCAATPNRCALAKNGRPADQIQDDFENLLYDLVSN